MRKWLAGAALAAICGGAIALPIMAQDKQDEKDRTKIERELESLQAQRDKITARMRELRKQLGRRDEDVTINLKESKELSTEQRREVERAVEEAHRAVRESLKNLPDVKAMIPDIEKSVRVFALPDGKGFKFDKNMSPEEREKFRKKMEEFGEKMGRMGEEMAKKFENFKFDFDGPNARAFKFDGPNVRVLRPRDGAGARSTDPEIRKELDDLRSELRQLRNEIRRGRGSRSSEERKPESEDTGLDL